MRVRVGFIGLGGVAQVHLKHVSQNENVELVAVCDIAKNVTEKTAQQYSAVSYTNFNQMLDNETLDALFVCVPPFAHGNIEEVAASKGIHLLIEKPLGLDMDTVRNKAYAIRKSGIVASTGYCLRYLNTTAIAKEYLEGKSIAMVRAYYLTKFVQTPWWKDMSKSGGQLVEQATHTVDLVRYLAGDVRKVYADMALQVMDDVPGINIPDVSSINMVFESGAIGNVTLSFTQHDHRSGLEILGRDFRLHLDEAALTIVEKGKTTIFQTTNDSKKSQDDAFIQAIIDGNQNLILASYDEAMSALEITLAANTSAHQGTPIILSQNEPL
jgi:predicted dehydrogenase